jgi:hypothetical protein
VRIKVCAWLLAAGSLLFASLAGAAAPTDLRYYYVQFDNKKAGSNLIEGHIYLVVNKNDIPQLRIDNQIRQRFSASDYTFAIAQLQAGDVDIYDANLLVYKYHNSLGTVVVDTMEGETCPRRP